MKFLAKQRGISLTEVLVTMVILGMGLIAVFKLQAYIIGFNRVAQQQSEAILLSHEKIEKLRNFSQITSQSGVQAYADIANGSETVSRANTTYTVTWNIAESTSPKQKVINTFVTWVDHKNTNQTINLSSVIAASEPGEQADLVDGAGAGSIQPQ